MTTKNTLVGSNKMRKLIFKTKYKKLLERVEELEKKVDELSIGAKESENQAMSDPLFREYMTGEVEDERNE